MPPSATELNEDFVTMIDSVFEDSDSVLIINPGSNIFQTIMLTAASFDNKLSDLQVLAEPGVLKASLEDFVLASQVANLIDRDVLELRTTTDIAQNSILVSDDEVVILVC